MEGLKKGWVEIDVKKLAKADWNYKEDDLTKSEKLRNNIKLNGQIENIIVRELDTGFFEVVNGNHRYEVFKELEFEKVMCFNLGKGISDEKAQRIAIETNETKFNTDNIKLAGLIAQILKVEPMEELVGTMPYSQEELENFEKMLEFNWGEIEEKAKSSSGTDDEFDTITLKLPKDIINQLNEQIDRFKRILHPEEKDLKKVSYVMAVEAICQILAQTPDKDVTGE